MKVLGLVAAVAVGVIGGSSLVSAQDDVSAEINVKFERVLEHLEIERPIVVTHAGDGSNRLFIASQYGTIYYLDSPDSKDEPQVFLDLEDKVIYSDNQNEEGFLGLAFHPDYKTNGRFFVYYTTKEQPHTSIISQFTVSPDDANRAAPESEVEIMRIEQPFWNHNGGTIAFGADGYLYVGLGDGGAANDPQGNGQNLGTLLGSLLRIDVDRRDGDQAYAIPKDNPFVGTPGARPEIYAYGLRNIWRMSFDRETGQGWIADVGQNLWEEVDLLVPGGNYGWNLREAMHPFGENGAQASDKFVEPIWEYHHDDPKGGKSITGGVVYRGQRLPQLRGTYLFGDYVSGWIWGLKYDFDAEKVAAHYTFNTGRQNVAVITFGEDEQGEVYFTDSVGRIFSFFEK